MVDKLWSSWQPPPVGPTALYHMCGLLIGHRMKGDSVSYAEAPWRGRGGCPSTSRSGINPTLTPPPATSQLFVNPQDEMSYSSGIASRARLSFVFSLLLLFLSSDSIWETCAISRQLVTYTYRLYTVRHIIGTQGRVWARTTCDLHLHWH